MLLLIARRSPLRESNGHLISVFHQEVSLVISPWSSQNLFSGPYIFPGVSILGVVHLSWATNSKYDHRYNLGFPAFCLKLYTCEALNTELESFSSQDDWWKTHLETSFHA